MSALSHHQVGDQLPPLELPPLSRTSCALFAGASGDHNPIHIDIDAAKSAGLPDVIGHGMLSMAQLGRLLTNWIPQARIRQFHARFQGITAIGDVISCSGRIVDKWDEAGATLLKVEICAADQKGHVKTVGEAVVSAG